MDNDTTAYTREDVSRILLLIADKIKKNVDLLAELDGLSGDGDLGETMGKSANAVIETAESCKEVTDIGAFLMKTALAMNKAAPSTLGTLLSCAVMAVAKETKGLQNLCPAEIVTIPRIMASAIGQKGKASPGDKTILDSLVPMSEAVISEFSHAGLKAAFHKGALAAKQGADSTASMIPKAGRAQWIGERVKDNLDGGAVLCAIVCELFLLDEKQEHF